MPLPAVKVYLVQYYTLYSTKEMMHYVFKLRRESVSEMQIFQPAGDRLGSKGQWEFELDAMRYTAVWLQVYVR